MKIIEIAIKETISNGKLKSGQSGLIASSILGSIENEDFKQWE